MLVNKLPEKRLYEIIGEAVEIEKEFISESLPVDLIGMNSNLMKNYIEYVADFWMNRAGYNKLYSTPNPFDWMDLLALQGKTNFFEKRVGDYQAGNMGPKIHDKNAGGW